MQVDFPLNRTIVGSCYTGMDDIPEAFFHSLVTSPPYWAVRDYETVHQEWPEMEYTMHGGMFPVKIPAWKGELGLEPDPLMYIGHLVLIARKAWRILRDDGTMWINIADSYAAATKKRTHVYYNGPEKKHRQPRKDVPGLKRKDLVGIPWLLAFALRDEGWYWRQDIVWSKKSSMPESVVDRCTRSHEYILLFAKKRFYYFDEFAIMTKSKWDLSNNKYPYGRAIDGSANDIRKGQGDAIRRQKNAEKKGYAHRGKNADNGFANKKNGYFDENGDMFGGGLARKRSVWLVGPQPTKEAHFATYPEKLIEPCIKAGVPERCCATCGAPYVRETSKRLIPTAKAAKTAIIDERDEKADKNDRGSNMQKDGFISGYINQRVTVAWTKTCDCDHFKTVPGRVYDPFSGSGTTRIVAVRENRHFLGHELNPNYNEIEERRVLKQLGLFSQTV